ncbi:hypothetical protein B0H14DRAFT_2590846 [Mycena olivaceomarginata]|nr:hypothetical protein B0H14DRAFT_2590846 [Mycena olivaceomarginata]
MALAPSPIGRLANELLSEIFLHALPQKSLPHTVFLPTTFTKPALTDAPLVLCHISSRWRHLAIHDTQLWTTLDTEDVSHPCLIQLWLSCTAAQPLSLCIARSLVPYPHWPSPVEGPIVLLRERDYSRPMHLHLQLLLPEIRRCRHLRIIDSFIPPFISPVAPVELESLSVTVRRGDTCAAQWFGQLLAVAPWLTHLHWEGPRIAAPWTQITHLSLRVDSIGLDTFEQILDAISHVQHLRLVLIAKDDRPFHEPHLHHIIPATTQFSFAGEAVMARCLTLPGLTHLIVEWMGTVYDLHELEIFLERSHCTLTVLELWGCQCGQVPPDILLSPQVSPLLTHLLIPSCDLNEFVLWMETRTPGSLPQPLILLRDIDRCFRIDDLPGITEPEITGVLAALLRAHLPLLEHLYLDDNESREDQLESRVIDVEGGAFTLRCSTTLRQEYESWWDSVDGRAFRTVRATGDLSSILVFDVPFPSLNDHPPGWQHPVDKLLAQSECHSLAEQNRFANTRRPGYQFK